MNDATPSRRFVNRYRWSLTYIAVIVTIVLALQILERWG